MADNWTRFPNVILDAFAEMEMVEARLTAQLVRETFGCHSDSVKMTWDDMQQATGLSRQSIKRAVELVEYRGFFVRGRQSLWKINSLKFRLFKRGKTLSFEVDYSLKSRLSEVDYSLEFRPKNSLKFRPEDGDNSLNSRPSSINIKMLDKETTTKNEILWEDVRELVNHFECETGIELGEPYYVQRGEHKLKQAYKENVIDPIINMMQFANGNTVEVMDEAIREMTKKDLTIATPKSIKAVFMRLVRQQSQPAELIYQPDEDGVY